MKAEAVHSLIIAQILWLHVEDSIYGVDVRIVAVQTANGKTARSGGLPRRLGVRDLLCDFQTLKPHTAQSILPNLAVG